MRPRKIIPSDAEDRLVAKMNTLYLLHGCQHRAIEEVQHPFRYNPKKKRVIKVDHGVRAAWVAYKMEVHRLTELQPLHKLKNYEFRGFKDWHVDHVLSIHEGFRRGLPAETIAHISNLRMLPADVNMKKRAKTVFTNLFNE